MFCDHEDMLSAANNILWIVQIHLNKIKVYR